MWALEVGSQFLMHACLLQGCGPFTSLDRRGCFRAAEPAASVLKLKVKVIAEGDQFHTIHRMIISR